MKKNITLVGCGNIGSRHLQALVQLPIPMTIRVVEKSKKSKKFAELRLNEIKFDQTIHQIFWYDSIDKLTNNSDLTIVSTLSEGRINLILKLLRMNNKKFLIEKPVCQSKSEFENLLAHMKSFKAVGWVNTNRRYFKNYINIKNELSKIKFINMNVFSQASGLGTNAIHFIDLFSWLLEDSQIKLNGEFLIPKIYPNKRGKQFREFYGTLVGSGKNNSSLSLTFLPSKTESIFVTIATSKINYAIDELNQEAFRIGNHNKKFDFKYEYASQLTTTIVHDILTKNTSHLPTLEESYLHHVELFRVFDLHLKKQLKRRISLCPIT